MTIDLTTSGVAASGGEGPLSEWEAWAMLVSFRADVGHPDAATRVRIRSRVLRAIVEDVVGAH